MNQPFKPSAIVPILADVSVSITELKRNPAAVIAEARLHEVAVLSRNRPVAYLISPEVWEQLCDLVEDRVLAREARAELAEGSGEEIEVDLDRYV
jgi:antitoxin StbD